MKSVFVTRSSALFVIFLAAEQAIVASSTFWLARLAAGLVGGGNLAWPFTGFVASLTLVYIPSIAKRTALAKAKITALERYIDACVRELWCLPHLSRSQAFQHDRRASIETESFLVIDEAFDFADFSLGLSLNVVFNVVALSAVFGARLLWAYMLTAVIAVAATAASVRRVRSDSALMQKSRSQAYGALADAWDAVTLGNTYNMRLWKEGFARKIASYRASASGAVARLELLTSATLWVSILPVVVVLARAMFGAASSVVTQTMVLATLPRQIQVIQCIADIVNCLLKWSAVRERVTGLFRAVAVRPGAKGLTGSIRPEKIVCMNAAGASVRLDDFCPPKTGRLTIRGENGSGKSTFLLEIKRRYPQASLILPTHSRLLFSSVADADVSTGQRLVRILEELRGVEPLSLLLLDEWDANLDGENMRRVDVAIDELARRCCVVEVRHR